MDVFHVTPINDLREHESSEKCWCNPVLDDEPSANLVWVHNSMDGRENYEPPYGKPLN